MFLTSELCYQGLTTWQCQLIWYGLEFENFMRGQNDQEVCKWCLWGKQLVDVIKVNINFPHTLSESKTGDPVPSDPSF